MAVKRTDSTLEKYDYGVIISDEKAEKVRLELRKYFIINGITHEDIAEKMGYEVQSVRNLLANPRMGKRRALLLAEAYGFNPEFLLTGKGKLIARASGYQNLVAENERLRSVIASQRVVIERQKAEIKRLGKPRMKRPSIV